jgi:hypothetical protein
MVPPAGIGSYPVSLMFTTQSDARASPAAKPAANKVVANKNMCAARRKIGKTPPLAAKALGPPRQPIVFKEIPVLTAQGADFMREANRYRDTLLISPLGRVQ